MTKNLDNEGLKSIAQNYDLFYIDLWGVMHNGIKLHEGAIFTLKKLLEINKNLFINQCTKTHSACERIFRKNGDGRKV